MLSRLIDDPASRAMGVRLTHDAPDGTIAFRQNLSPAQLDSRGGIPIRSIGVLIDSTVGSAAYQVTKDAEAEFVVSHLSVSLAVGDACDGVAIAVAQDCALDPVTGTGLSTARVESAGRLRARVTCRSVKATRSRLDDGASATHGASSETMPRTSDLGLSPAVRSSSSEFETRWAVHPWMGNGLGSVQGGVILSCAAAVADQVVGSGSRPHEHHDVIDLSLDILRSPTTTGVHEYHWTSTELRRGRRLTVMSSTLHDDGGRVYATSTATALRAL